MSMTCAACGADNRAGRKFCGRCGAALGATCAACGTANQPDELFCGECGSALASTPAPTRSPEKVSVSGEKKHITVLFADVAGSMDLQERLDAEVWAQIMGRFVSILAEGVRKFGGTVDKFTGDGIMALFGAPVAQEDHARRACHAAWHLTKVISEFSAELRREHGVDLQVRLGLNSGEVVVGRVGDDVTLDPTALGHTVGLAQRMEAMAEPGTACLTQYTGQLVEGWFVIEDLGLMSVKGAHEQLQVYALAGPAASPPVLHGAGLGIAPLVGREQELAVLEEALAAAMEGHAQVVGVVGEAGVGKSRLCDEFARAAAARGITVRRTGGLAHGKDVPLLPILSFLRDYFGITDSDAPHQAREKITGRLLDLDPALHEALPLVFDLLEVPDPDRPAPRLGPEVRMHRIFEVIRRVTERRSEREVLLLLFEDLHWFDPQSESFLERLIESYPGSRTMVVTNFRPEFAAHWMRHAYCRRLPLAPLPDEAVGELLGGLLGVDSSLVPLLALVREHTGGNPFFVEEVVRALVEDGTLAGVSGHYRLTRPLQEIHVPPSVQAVLAARIDRLPAGPKAVLQTAAVIGRSFSEPVLAHVAAVDQSKLDEALHDLCAAEFLQQTGRHRIGEYRFWHPLTQEVAYGTLLAQRRRPLHRAVAEALLKHYPDRLDEQAALIAAHFQQANHPLEAARWNDRAATWALRSDMTEAMKRWRTVVELLDGEQTEEPLRLVIRALSRLVRLGARTGTPLDEDRRLYHHGRALAERLGDGKLLAGVTFAFGTAVTFRGAIRQGFEVYLEALRLAEQTGDRALEAAVLSAPGRLLQWLGPVTESFRLLDRVVELCAGDEDVGAETLGYGVLGYQHQIRAELLGLAGQPARAWQCADDGVAIHRRRSEAEMLAWALTVHSGLARNPSEASDALARAQQAVRITEELGNTAIHVVALRAVGAAQIGLERFGEAADTLESAVAEARGRGVGLWEEAPLLTYLAQARLGSGTLDIAQEAADEAIAVARREEAKIVECHALLTRGRILARRPAPQAAANDLDGALALVCETGAVVYEPFIREELARLHMDEIQLREALRLYRQIGAAGHVCRLEAELSTEVTQ